jgi:protein-S-isoprenylcysteine O-methyltransferase Ste14
VHKKYGIRAKWGRFFGLAFIGWTVIILIYFFNYDSMNWIWKLSILDNAFAKIVAMAVMCGALLLYVLFTITVGTSIRRAVNSGGKPELITTGVYRYSRHPSYLAFFAVAFGVFLLIPNLITLVLLVYTWVVTFGHTLEEEKKLGEMYGEEYERYRNEVGMFLPKL